MAHAAAAGDGDDREIPRGRAAAAGRRGARGADAALGRRRRRDERGAAAGRPRAAPDACRTGPIVRLFIGAGRQAGIRPGDLVGAITGEAGVESRSLGAIEIADKFSLIDVPEALADDIIAALKATTIRGKKVPVRRERSS